MLSFYRFVIGMIEPHKPQILNLRRNRSFLHTVWSILPWRLNYYFYYRSSTGCPKFHRRMGVLFTEWDITDSGPSGNQRGRHSLTYRHTYLKIISLYSLYSFIYYLFYYTQTFKKRKRKVRMKIRWDSPSFWIISLHGYEVMNRSLPPSVVLQNPTLTLTDT